jgi:hypothetical protein
MLFQWPEVVCCAIGRAGPQVWTRLDWMTPAEIAGVLLILATLLGLLMVRHES